MSSIRKNIVFILGSYYPNYSAVGKCLGNIADILEEDYNITVISMKNKFDQEEKAIYRRQDIIRVSTKYLDKRMIIKEKIKASEGIKKYIYLKCEKILRLYGFFRIIFSKNTIDKALEKKFILALQNINSPIDYIIPTCSPFESINAALKFKERKDVEIIPFISDLFAENNNLNRCTFNKRLKKKANMRLERKMLEHSKCIFYVSNWTDYLNENFSEFLTKSIEVEHPLLIKKNECINKSYDENIHIVYTGILDEKIRNPEFALELLIQMSKDIVGDFYSFGSGNIFVEKQSNKFPEKVISHGKVTSVEASKARLMGNILLSIGNKNVTQIPSKTFEYISTGKAILHIAENSSDPTIKLLDKYPAKMIVIKNEFYDIGEIEKFIRKNQFTDIPFDSILKMYYFAYPPYICEKMKSQLTV